MNNSTCPFLGFGLGLRTEHYQHVQSTPRYSAAERLNIYAYAYKARLKEAIETDYEKLHDYLGNEQFDALLERYVGKYPSQQTNLSPLSYN